MLHPSVVEMLLRELTYKPGYVINWEPKAVTRQAAPFAEDDTKPYKVYNWSVWIAFNRMDALTGQPGVGESGRVDISSDMSPSQIVRRVFGMCMALEEHECREFFKYKGFSIFGPHIDVESLLKISNDYD